MNFKAGDRVSFLDEEGTAEILEIRGQLALLLTEDGFELEYPLNKLVPRPGSLSNALLSKPLNVKDAPVKTTISAKKQKPDYLEVDLHLHELVEKYSGFTKNDVLNYQLNHAKKHFFKARKAGVKKIIFIHGVGEGILKQELRKMLSSFDGITFYDADYTKYGLGATAVEIFKKDND